MYSAFFHDRCSYFYSFSLSSGSCLTTGPSAQHSKALGVLVLLGDAAFLSWAFPYACLRTKQWKEQDCEIIPLLHNNFRTPEDLLQHALAFYLSIYFLSFFRLSVVDIGLLFGAFTFARKQDRTLILNRCKPLQKLFLSFVLRQSNISCVSPSNSMVLCFLYC